MKKIRDLIAVIIAIPAFILLSVAVIIGGEYTEQKIKEVINS